MHTIEIVPVLNDNYVYIIHNHEKCLTSVIDPGDAEPVIKKLKERNWHLNEIINTHHHGDHIAGNNELIDLYGSKLIAPLYDKSRIKKVDKFVSDNDLISIAGYKTKVIHTPGHTLGHVCYYLEHERILFSGDTLFRLGCGRVFEGTMQQMKKSLDKLKVLPDDTNIYCGHEYTLSNSKFCLYLQPNNYKLNKKFIEISEMRKKNLFTVPFKLGEEKDFNPFLQYDKESFKKSINHQNKNNDDIFTYLRTQKDKF